MAKNLTSGELQIQAIQTARKRRQRALALKKSGKSYREVAKLLKVSRGRAQQLVEQARDEAAG